MEVGGARLRFLLSVDRGFCPIQRFAVGVAIAVFTAAIGGSSILVDPQALYRVADSRRSAAVYQYSDSHVYRAYTNDVLERIGLVDCD
jgi:hypothetical protein